MVWCDIRSKMTIDAWLDSQTSQSCRLLRLSPFVSCSCIAMTKILGRNNLGAQIDDFGLQC